MSNKPGPKGPSKYDKAFCEQVVEWGKAGKSITWIASRLNVSRETIYAWARDHAEFSDAITLARTHSQACWEDLGQDNLLTPGFSASAWSRSMAARFPDDWRENAKLEHSGEVAVKTIERVIVDPAGE